MEAVRGEPCSHSSSLRKNCEWTVDAIVKMKRKILGRRGDLLLRKITTEYGCAEAGRLFDGQNGTKLLQERGLKMPKMLKDIFDQLCVLVDEDEQKIRKLETIGFLHAGLMLRLDSPAGYICRVSHTASLSIATQMTEFGKRTLPVILLAWKAKATVASTIRLIEQTDYADEEDELRRLENACERGYIYQRARILRQRRAGRFNWILRHWFGPSRHCSGQGRDPIESTCFRNFMQSAVVWDTARIFFFLLSYLGLILDDTCSHIVKFKNGDDEARSIL